MNEIVYLKVKIKSLAAEAGIIRQEEQRAKTTKSVRKYLRRCVKLGMPINLEKERPDRRPLTNSEREIADRHSRTPSDAQMTLFWNLRGHRTREVRREARAAQLAYAILRGRTYHKTEGHRTRTNMQNKKTDWARVAELVAKFGGRQIKKAEAELIVAQWVKYPTIPCSQFVRERAPSAA